MIVEQTQRVHSEEEAEDTLAGWRNLPTFLMAYVKAAVLPEDYDVVGIFSCAEGKLVRGQRHVKKAEIKGGWTAS